MNLLDGVKYAVRELRENYGDREWYRERLVHRGGMVCSTLRYGSSGIDVPSESWDNLIVLDACRADLFEEIVDLDVFDDYHRATSKGSMTREWARKNWSAQEHGDTVYVNSNPLVSQGIDAPFFRQIEVWHDGFDDETNTILPETMRDRALDSYREDKRLVVHFIQPHHPFYVVDGFEFTEEPWLEWVETGQKPLEIKDPWEAIRWGAKSREEVWDAYGQTLSAALPSVWALVKEIPGRTVVTSDHGNMTGEWGWPLPLRIYGHPPDLRYPELTQVPWGVIEDERRSITTGPTSTPEESVPDEVVNHRLEALGYR